MGTGLTQLLEFSPYFSVFIMGFMGGVHCLGMCGGIVSALSFGLSSPEQKPSLKSRIQSRLPILLGYNMGRITSYVIAGALAGGLGALSLAFANPEQTRNILNSMQIISALFMIALGLYLANIWHGIAYIEHAGKGIWKHLEPLGRRFLPVDSLSMAFPFGFIWGWLPCGLVYTVLIMSLSSGSTKEGALLMLCFGLGTLPNLLLMGVLADHLLQWVRKPTIRLGAGLTIIGLGLWMLYQVMGNG